MAAAANDSELYCACRDGDISNAKRLIPHTSLAVLNRLESDGSSCLHAASRNGHGDIVHLLLQNGASRQIKDKNGRTPLELALTKEVADIFHRPIVDAIKRHAEQPKWLFGQDEAEAYSRAIHRGKVKDRGVKKTVEKIENAHLLPDDDGSKESKIFTFYMNEAREKNDPLFFVKAYTLNGSFYDYLNKYMATGSSRDVFKKICHGWSGYYTGAIMKNPALKAYHFSGVTYRGMAINTQDLEQYQPGVALTNKAFQSTSKSMNVALNFAQVREPAPDKVSVIIHYTIVDRKSALDIKTLSEYPDEEEVLMVPGILFKVDHVNTNTEPCEIYLRQLPWT